MLSNAQRKQIHRADAENQRHRIIIEPMAISPAFRSAYHPHNSALFLCHHNPSKAFHDSPTRTGSKLDDLRLARLPRLPFRSPDMSRISSFHSTPAAVHA